MLTYKSRSIIHNSITRLFSILFEARDNNQEFCVADSDPPLAAENNAPKGRFWLAVAVLLLAGGSWAATFFVSVPLHNALAAQGRDSALIARLVQTNWGRTGLWSAPFLLDAAGG